MEQVGAALAEHRVAAVYLVHGQHGADGGDYTEQYVRWFESSLYRPGGPRIPVRMFHWSGEPNHLGRADGAVRLVDELVSQELAPGQRVLLWGHDEAGNVLALASRLVTGDRDETARFFQAAAIYYRWPLLGCVDIPVWERVRTRLRKGPVLQGVFLDQVTFGTAVRYRGGLGAQARLLQFFDAGTIEPPCRDVRPARSAWRARAADRRLHRLFESCQAGDDRDFLAAQTVFEDRASTLLVQYDADADAGPPEARHAVYARQEWLLFHAEEVARRFYATRMARVA
jgi:hypothetical protein